MILHLPKNLFQGPILFSILCGILLVLSVMMAITCLLVHHNKHLKRLQLEGELYGVPHYPGVLLVCLCVASAVGGML